MSERRRCLLVVAVLVALIATQYAGAVLGGGVYHFEDAADSFRPAREMTRRAFAEGTLPLWEPGAWAGWPAVVDPYNGVYYPPNVLYALGSARGLGYSVALHALLAALGLFAFLRQRRLGVPASLIGALGYALSTFMVVWVRHIDFIQMAAWLPWMLWATDRWLERRQLSSLLLLALFGGLALLTGALSLLAIGALPVVAYAAARLVVTWYQRTDLPRGRRVTIDLLGLAAAGGVAVLLAMAQLAPSLAHLPESPRALGTSYEFAASYAWPNVRYLMTLFVPDIHGNDMRGGYFGAFNYWEMTGYYVGLVTWMLAPLALCWRPSGSRRRVELVVLAVLALISVGAALGANGPVHRLLYHGLPLYATLRCPPRGLVVVVLVLPILAAHGADALLAGLRAGTRRSRARTIVAALAAAGAVALGVAVLLQVPAAKAAPYMAAWRLLIVAALTGAVVVLCALGWVPARVAGLALAALLATDLLWQGWGYLKAEPGNFPEGSDRFQALEWVRHHGQGWRFVNDGNGPFRLHNVGMTYGLENISGYDSVPIWRYRNYLHIINTGKPYPHPKLQDDLAAAAVGSFGSRLLDLLNVRYVITDRPLAGRRYALVFRPDPRGPTLAWAERAWDAHLKVYENRDVLPRAFVVYRSRLVESPAAAAAAIASSSFDPGAEVVLEGASVPEPVPGGAGAVARTAATVRQQSRHRIVIDAKAERDGILVLSEVYYPGWQARVDGRPVPLLRANYALRGIALGAGVHEVELTYRNRAALGGIGVSAVAWLLLLAAAAVLWRRSRGAAVGCATASR